MIFLDCDGVKLKRKVGLLEKGTLGAVVMCFDEPKIAYLVEFCDNDGCTIDMPILKEEDIELAWRDGQNY